ncbi:hypothetical protein B9Z55_000709 [Caenorhabditis nigoni]|nr:hypothetical protein B9Z55_000709 [Caenorhabditis nigoni]
MALTGGTLYSDEQLDSKLINTLISVSGSYAASRRKLALEEFPNNIQMQRECSCIRTQEIVFRLSRLSTWFCLSRSTTTTCRKCYARLTQHTSFREKKCGFSEDFHVKKKLKKKMADLRINPNLSNEEVLRGLQNAKDQADSLRDSLQNAIDCFEVDELGNTVLRPQRGLILPMFHAMGCHALRRTQQQIQSVTVGNVGAVVVVNGGDNIGANGLNGGAVVDVNGGDNIGANGLNGGAGVDMNGGDDIGANGLNGGAGVDVNGGDDIGANGNLANGHE